MVDFDCEFFCLGQSLYETKASGSVLNRGKKRQVKADVGVAGVAWGKLISQYSKVCFLKVRLYVSLFALSLTLDTFVIFGYKIGW